MVTGRDGCRGFDDARSDRVVAGGLPASLDAYRRVAVTSEDGGDRAVGQGRRRCWRLVTRVDGAGPEGPAPITAGWGCGDQLLAIVKRSTPQVEVVGWLLASPL